MLLNLLTALPEGGRMVEIPEALLYALIGFTVVFVGIAFLITVVWGVGKVMSLKKATVTAPAPKQTVENVTSKPTAETQVVDDETVAVIMAALTAYYETNNPKCEFRVKRIKRI